MSKIKKSLQDLTLLDRFLFAEVMEDPKTFENILSIILGEDISIKATTTEKLGFTGRQEGIAAYATVLIQK